MATLTQEMKDMVSNFQCFIATVSKDCVPDIGPKRSTRVLDDQTLLFNEGTAGTTYKNLLNGSKAVVAVVNRDIPDGYRFVCHAEVQSDGELYNQAAAASENAGRPKPTAVVLLHIDEIHSLRPGPTAGKKIS